MSAEELVRVHFARGCGFGLGTKFAAVSLASLTVGGQRAEQVRSLLRAELQVPRELWDTVQLPRDRCAAMFGLCVIAIQTHLRQAIGWKAATIGDPAVPFGSKFRSSLALPYMNAPLARDLFAEVARWLGDPRGSDVEGLNRILAGLSERHRAHLLSPIAKGILGFRALQLGYPLFEDEIGGFVIGQGARRRTFHGLHTDHSAVIAGRLCSNKFLTARRLARSGLPTAVQRVVRSADEAAAAAEEMGYPLVIKPADLERGTGVTNDLRSADELRAAYAAAREKSANVLLEKHIQGRTHRLTVVEGEVVSAVRRLPGGVTGNGRDTVAGLIDLFNAEPMQVRRTLRDGKTPLSLDAEALKLIEREGMQANSVPAEGAFVQLRAKDNMRAGGTNDRLDLAVVHADNVELAIGAAQAMMLDIAGVDLIIPDIGRSWREQTCTICEVNSDPEMGNADAVYPFARLLAQTVGSVEEAGRIPLTLHIAADAAQSLGQRPASSDARWYCDAAGLLRGDAFLAGPFADGFAAARAALANTRISELDLRMNCSEVLQLGLPADRFDRIVIGAMPQPQITALRNICQGHGPITPA